MALVLQDRVSVNSTGSGTGSLVLGSAYPGYRTFASCIPNGSTVYYTITNQAIGYDTQWEVGTGTYTLGSNTLSRNAVLSSSNAGALVNFTAGTNGLQIFIAQPAGKAVYQETNGDVLIPNGILTTVGPNATNPTFNATLGEFVSNQDGFSQLFVQNQSSGANASADLVAYNNLGDGVSYFVDMGINSSTYNSADYPIFQANDAYLLNAGNVAGTGASGDISRLMLGTSTANSNVVIFGGSVNVNAVIATFVASTKNVNFANNISVTGNASANNVTLTNLAYAAGNVSAGANNTVLTTKAYVDSAVATGFTVHTPCVYATTTALPTNTYNNGTLGVGATLTATANGALSVDGSAVTTSQRILVKDEVAQANNGVYTVTQTGSAGTPYILTRATDFDVAAAGEIANNAYFFVTAGVININDSFILSQLTSPIVVGTTALPFTLFSNQLVYTGSAPINVSGQTISLTGIVPIANGGTNLSSYTTGDVIYSNATNTLTRRAIGASNSVLVSNGAVPDWGTVALGSASAVSGALGATNGGTGQATYTLGDIIYSNATNSLAKLAGQTTTTQKFLSQTGTGTTSEAPSWSTVPASSVTGLATSATTDTSNASNITSGTLANARTTAASANGASTIVARDINGSFTANVVTATHVGDGSGLSSLNGSNVTTGTVANARTTATNLNTASTIVARDISGNFSAGTITAALSGTASTATNIAGGAAGSLPYQTGSGATSLLAAGTGVLVGGTTPAYTTTPTLTGTNFTGIPNAGLTNSSVTVTAGTGLSGGGAIALGASATLNIANTSVTPGSYTSASITVDAQGRLTAASSGAAAGTTITNDTTTNGTYYPWLTTSTTGSVSTANVSSTKLSFNPSTGALSANGVVLTGNTLTAGTGISVSASTGASTITNTGVTSAVAGTGVSVSGATGAVTFSIGQAVATSSNVQFNSLGVGTAGSAVAGEIRATNNITAYYSDERLKTKIGSIENALDKVKQIETMVYHANETAVGLGYDASIIEVGVTAQSVQKVMPQTVAPAPIDDKYLTVRYERLVPLLIEAIKELEAQVAELKAK